MADCEIKFIVFSSPVKAHENIVRVGNPEAGWEWPVERVIASMDAAINTFYILDVKTGKRTNVGVQRPKEGKPCLRAYADKAWNDRLLSMPVGAKQPGVPG